MRYFLMVVGFLGGAAGLFGYGNDHHDYERLWLAIFIAGALFFAVGVATVDIVEEIRAGRKGGEKRIAPVEGEAQQPTA
jgi:hypothetical protein